jgi:hypothetical protein
MDVAYIEIFIFVAGTGAIYCFVYFVRAGG